MTPEEQAVMESYNRITAELAPLPYEDRIALLATISAATIAQQGQRNMRRQMLKMFNDGVTATLREMTKGARS